MITGLRDKPVPVVFTMKVGSSLFAVALAIGAPAAKAQDLGPFLGSPIPITVDRGQNLSVVDRPRPEYDPIGVKLGGFTLLPSAKVGVGYSDNVFGSSTDRRGDMFVAADPEVLLKSDWSIHSLRLTGGGAIRRFADNSIRNETGLYLRARGRLDLGRDNAIDLSAGILRAFQPQYSSAAPINSLEPIQYTQTNAAVRGKRQLGRFLLTLGVDYVDLNFRDVEVTSGTVLDQDYRDRGEARAAGRVEYAITPNTSVFGEIDASKISFNQKVVASQPNRDGASYTALAGISLDLTALIRARVGAGYIKRTFDAGNVYRDIGGFAYDVRLEYFPSGLTTVTVGAVRSIEETVDVVSSGYFSSSFLGRVDHELLRNMLLFGAVQYQRNKFQGLARRDDILSARAGGTYRVSRAWALTGELGYVDRSGAGAAAGSGFDEWRGTVSVTFRL